MDPKITLGVGIGMIISASFFLLTNMGSLLSSTGDLDEGLPDTESNQASQEDLLFPGKEPEEINFDKEKYSEQDMDRVKPGAKGEKELQSITVEIPEGMAADEISVMLERREVIADAEAFVDYLVAEGKITSIQPGEYELAPDANKREIVEKLTQSP